MRRAMRQETRYDVARRSGDAQGHKYAYTFDLDVMHPFMLRSFEPFFNAGSVLELGSFRGDFTRRLTARFADITCVEASGEALAARARRSAATSDSCRARSRRCRSTARFDNIVLTHVLEHLDDPVGVLARVNREWLSRVGPAVPGVPQRQRAVAADRGPDGPHRAQRGGHAGRARARPPHHLFARHARARRARRAG